VTVIRLDIDEARQATALMRRQSMSLNERATTSFMRSRSPRTVSTRLLTWRPLGSSLTWRHVCRSLPSSSAEEPTSWVMPTQP